MTELEFETTCAELRSVLMEAIQKLDDAADRSSRLLNEHKAAKYLDVSPGTLRNWRDKNIGPRSMEIEGGKGDGGKKLIRYDIDDLDKWITEHPRRKELPK
ncbi:helix-turn-helix domain-containing protein [Cloacibacillus porcorum]|uniref:Helix-turn-helix domain-containing protein n=1 Tax=Cloacibacillus porcorum TaxID=1197717 RepID=A0A1B2I6A2_9BACT|nr:helix-turn-helix domain-containing protein [Cloacibacillus porcorum]ANZ45476.1 hypothetical protein BED41_10595 [Cloacibacillus porcorum]